MARDAPSPAAVAAAGLDDTDKLEDEDDDIDDDMLVERLGLLSSPAGAGLDDD